MFKAEFSSTYPHLAPEDRVPMLGCCSTSVVYQPIKAMYVFKFELACASISSGFWVLTADRLLRVHSPDQEHFDTIVSCRSEKSNIRGYVDL